MFTFIPRRMIRRPVAVVAFLSVLVYFLGFSSQFGLFPQSPLYSSFSSTVGTTRLHLGRATTVTRTQFLRVTRTVYAPDATGAPDRPPRIREDEILDGEIDASLPKLEKHTYRKDGLLEVNPRGPHPIYELISRAEANWEAKMNKASKTLEEACREYERRYRRLPPLGFDKWWAYVQENQVQLPDEYDQIYDDLEPYWGMNPTDLQGIQRDWEAHADSYTVGKDAQDDSIVMLNYTLPGNTGVKHELAEGAFQVMELLEDVEKHIPPFRAVFSPHDNPNLPTDYELREMALDAAASGRFININNPPEYKLHGWISGCDPLSPAWRDPIKWDSAPPPRTKKTFIYDHREAMDPCQHPDLLVNHGQFLSHHTGPVPHRVLIPQFSYCPTLLHHDIMAAMPINWVEDILPRSFDPEWEEKYDDRLQWRGTNTGIWHDEDTLWPLSQRARLVEWATNAYHENVTVLPAPKDNKRAVGEGVTVRKAKYSSSMLDVAFANAPLSCAPKTCELLKEVFEFRKPQDWKTAGKYKYIIDVDGNGWSSRFKRLITSNSLIFKSTIYPEWFTDRIEPWVHYVPVQNDLSDLFDSLVFFRGDPTGTNAHDDMARKIAYAGRAWSKKFWRKEDLTAYMFRLFLEYARVMSTERLSMFYNHGTPGSRPPPPPLVDDTKPPPPRAQNPVDPEIPPIPERRKGNRKYVPEVVEELSDNEYEEDDF